MKNFAIILALIFALTAAFADSKKSNFDEDGRILEALDAVDANDDERAIKIYQNLYEKTAKIEYLKEQILALVRLKKMDEALALIAQYEQHKSDDLDILKIKTYGFRLKNDLDSAIKTYEKVAELENNAFNNGLLAELYLRQNDLPNARKYLLRAYEAESEESVLLLIVTMDMRLARNLGEHSGVYIKLIKEHFKDEMSAEFAYLLLEIGRKFDAYGELESLFLHFYDKSATLTNAKNLAYFYYFKKDYDKIPPLAQKFDFGVDFLIDVYVAKKDYENAKLAAKKAFESTQDKHYIGVLAIIEFEAAADKAQIAHQTTENLKTAIQDKPNHTFLNYLGYLLIDFDINVAQGVEYVKQALEFMPDNPAYLDSLAWGYYKSARCEDAKATMDRIAPEVFDKEAELREHLEIINKCLGNF